jgi:hypothetical protein
MFVLSYLTVFSNFCVEQKQNQKLQYIVRTFKKITLLKRGVDGVSYFFIDFHLFYFLPRIVPDGILV